MRSFNLKYIFLIIIILILSLTTILYINHKVIIKTILEHYGYEIIKTSLRESLVKKTRDDLTKIIEDKNKTLIKLENKIHIEKYFNDKNIDQFVKQFKFTKLSSDKNYPIIEFYENKLFRSGINGLDTKSFYLSFSKDEIYFASAIGVIGKTKLNSNGKEFVFDKIETNLVELIATKNFITNKESSVKDILVINNEIYVSFTKELSENCWNTSIARGDLKNDFIKFKVLFSPETCVNEKNEDMEFNMTQSGGKIAFYNNKNIFFSVGDYRLRYLSQEINSPFGKLLKINTQSNNNDYEAMSLGNRNIQGLFYDKKDQKIYMTEHGPKGGDEINIIDLKNNDIPNFGWPISSYGEHYTEFVNGKSKYDKSPLHKSHKNYGFKEPIKYFVPSIGIKDIIKINDYLLVSSLKASTLFVFKIENNNSIKEIKKVEVGQRIRDMDLYNNKLFLSLESSNNIGVINLDNLI